VCTTAARYITLHGGLGALGGEVHNLQQECIELARGLTMAFVQATDAWDEARSAHGAVTTVGLDASRAMTILRKELADVKMEWAVLESTVLTLSAAVTSLLDHAGMGLSSDVTNCNLDK
jgi:hypothetical protein